MDGITTIIDDDDDKKYNGLSLEQYYFVKILEFNPQIQSIVTCYDGDDSYSCTATNVQRNVCFKNSQLYSIQTEYMLDMNSCCRKGQQSIFSCCDDTTTTTNFPLSLWSLVLHRAKKSASKTHCHPQSPSYYCQQCHHHQQSGSGSGDDSELMVVDDNNENNDVMMMKIKEESQKQQQQQREASLLFTLLQGPVFAARGNNYICTNKQNGHNSPY